MAAELPPEISELESRSNLGEWRALTVIVPLGVMLIATVAETVIVYCLEEGANNPARPACPFRVLGDFVHGSAMLFAFGLVWFAADQVSRVKEVLSKAEIGAPKAQNHAAWLRAFAIGLIVFYFISLGADLVIALAPVRNGWERATCSTLLLITNTLVVASAYLYGTAGLKITKATIQSARKRRPRAVAR